jgi:hypothetical protein
MTLFDELLAISSELGMRPLMQRVLYRRELLVAWPPGEGPSRRPVGFEMLMCSAIRAEATNAKAPVEPMWLVECSGGTSPGNGGCVSIPLQDACS